MKKFFTSLLKITLLKYLRNFCFKIDRRFTKEKYFSPSDQIPLSERRKKILRCELFISPQKW